MKKSMVSRKTAAALLALVACLVLALGLSVIPAARAATVVYYTVGSYGTIGVQPNNVLNETSNTFAYDSTNGGLAIRSTAYVYQGGTQDVKYWAGWAIVGGTSSTQVFPTGYDYGSFDAGLVSSHTVLASYRE